LEKEGMQVLRFSNEQVLKDLEDVIKEIENLLKRYFNE